MMSTSPILSPGKLRAIQDAETLLLKYTDKRTDTNTPSKDMLASTSLYTPPGSVLIPSSARKSQDVPSDTDENESLLLIRSVIFQIDDICQQQNSSISIYEHLPLLSKMLHGVEEKLDIEIQQKQLRASLLATPGVGSDGRTPMNHADGIRSVLKVFMNNQLDLNTSEMEYYEGVINECIEKLEGLEQDLEMAAIEKKEMESQLISLQSKLEETERTSQLNSDSLVSRIESLSLAYDTTNQLFLQEQQRNSSLQAEVDSTRSMLQDSTAQIDNLKNILDSETSEEAGKEDVIEGLQVELDDAREQLQDLARTLVDDESAGGRAALLKAQEMRMAIEAAEAEKFTLASQILELEVEVTRLNDLIGNYEASAELQSKQDEDYYRLVSENDTLQADISDLKSQLQSTLLTISQLKALKDEELDSDEGEAMNTSGVKQLKETNESLQYELEELISERDELNEANMKWIEYKAAIDGHIADLEGALDLRTQELESKSNNFEDLLSEFESLSSRYSAIKNESESKSSSKQGEEQSLRQLVSDADEELKQLRIAIDKKDKQINELMSSSALAEETFTRRVSHLTLVIQQKDNEVTALETQISSVQGLLRDVEIAKEHLQHEQHQLSSTVEGLKSRLHDRSSGEKDLMENISDLKTQLEEKSHANTLLTSQLLALQKQQKESMLVVEELKNDLKYTREDPRSNFKSPLASPSQLRYQTSTPSSASRNSMVVSGSLGATEVRLKLASAEYALEELRSEVDSLQSKLEFKTHRLEEVTKELAKVKTELDLRKETVDEMRAREIAGEAGLQATLIEKDRLLVSLKRMVDDLEQKYVEVNALLQESHAELLSEKDVNFLLRDLIGKIENKAAQEIKDERERLLDQMEAVSVDLRAKSDDLNAFRAKNDSLQAQLESTLLQLTESTSEYEKKRFLLVQELDEVKGQLESSDGAAYARMNELNTHLEDLAHEKESVEKSLDEAKLEIAALSALKSKYDNELVLNTKALKRVAEEVVYFQKRIKVFEEALQKQVHTWTSKLESKLEESISKVEICKVRQNQLLLENNAAKEDYARQMDDVKHALKLALSRAVLSEGENETMKVLMEDVVMEKTRIERELQLAERHLSDSQLMLRNREENVNVEDFAKLVDKLESAELRAQEAATESVKEFASSARTIAYLESECSRLKSLVDHFRCVNIKLGEDVKEAQVEGVKLHGLEYRLKVLHEDYVALQARLLSTEQSLKDKQQEVLDVLKVSRETDEVRSIQLESEVNALSASLKSVSEKYQTATGMLESLREQSLGVESELQQQILAVKLQYSNLLDSTARKNDEMETLRIAEGSLSNALSEREADIVDLQKQLKDEDKKHALIVGEYCSKIQNLESTLSSKQTEITCLEEERATLKNDMTSVELSLADSQAALAKAASKLADTSDETRLLRVQLENIHRESSSKVEDIQELADANGREVDYLKNALQEAHAEIEHFRKNGENIQKQYSVDFSDLYQEKIDALNTISTLTQQLNITQSDVDTLQLELQNAKLREANIESVYRELDDEKNLLHTQLTESIDMYNTELIQVNKLKLDVSTYEDKYVNAEQRIMQLMDTVMSLQARKKETEDTEELLVSTMNDLSVRLSEGIHSIGSSDVVHSDMFTSPGPGRIELFRSPDLTVFDERDFNGPFGKLRYSLSTIKSKSEHYLTRGEGVQTALLAKTNELNEVKSLLHSAEVKLETSMNERTSLATDFERLKTEYNSTSLLLHNITSDKDAVQQRNVDCLILYNQFCDRLSTVLTDNVARAQLIGTSDDFPSNMISFSPMVRKPSQYDTSNSVEEMRASIKSMLVEVEKACEIMQMSIESVAESKKVKIAQLRGVDEKLADLQASFQKEKVALGTQIKSLDGKIDEEKSSYLQLQASNAQSREEIAKLKAYLVESTQNVADLQTEMKAATANNNDLRQALHEAEAFCSELQAKVRDYQSNTLALQTSMETLEGEVDKSRKQMAVLELQNEKNQSAITRFKAEREANDRIKEVLEAELMEARGELNVARINDRPSQEETKLSFEVEKLLVALGVTMSQIAQSSTLEEGEPSSELSTLVNKLKAQELTDSTTNLLTRMDSYAGCLVLFRTCMREEHKVMRSIKEKLKSVEASAKDSLSIADSAQLKLKQSLQIITEKEIELNRVNDLLLAANADKKKGVSEIDRLKSDLQTSLSVLAEEKQRCINLTDVAKDKDIHILRLTTEMKGKESEVEKKMHDQLQLQQQLLDVSSAIKLKEEQLRLANGSNAELAQALHQLQDGSSMDVTERRLLEQKILKYDATVSVLERCKQSLVESEDLVTHTREQLRRAQEEYHALDERHQVLQSECDGVKRKSAGLESKSQSLAKDKEGLLVELNDIKSSLSTTKLNLQEEHSKRVMLEKSLDSLRRTEEEQRSLLVKGQATVATEAAKRSHSVEEECKILRSTVSSLQSTLEISEAQRASEADSRKKTEALCDRLRVTVEKSKQEQTKLLTSSSAFRSDGRTAKKAIMSAVSLVKELISLVKSDASSIGIDLTVARSAGTESVDDASLNLLEALCIGDLNNAISALNPLILWAKDSIRAKREAALVIRRLEDEAKRGIVEPIDEGKYQALLVENDRLVAQIAEMRRSDKVDKLARQVTELTSSLAKERAMKEEAVSSLRHSQVMVRDLSEGASKESAAFTGTVVQSDLYRKIEEMRIEVNSMNKEANTLRHELKAANHHREVLKDTIEHLEKQLKTTADALAEAKVQAYSRSMKGDTESADESEAMRRQNTRYKVRAVALDEVVATYRKAVMNMSAEEGKKSLVSHEVSVLKRSYEEEISALESELSELNGKVAQGETFIRELRKQLEDNSRALYKPGKQAPSEALLAQLDGLKSEVSESERRVKDLEYELNAERKKGRKRASLLTDELNKSIQLREASVYSLKKLEASVYDKLAPEQRILFDSLRSDLNATSSNESRVEDNKSKTIHNLMRGLVQSDNELSESQRLLQRYQSTKEGQRHRSKQSSSREYSSMTMEPQYPTDSRRSRSNSGDKDPFVVRHAPMESAPRGMKTTDTVSPINVKSPARHTKVHPPIPAYSNVNLDSSYSMGTIGSGTGSLRVKPSMTVVYPPDVKKK